jgi:chitinase
MDTKTSKKWTERALVGYVAAYGSTIPPNVTTPMIRNAVDNNYSVFVYAFGIINSDDKLLIPSGITESDLQEQIRIIHDNNGLALISFGGQNNTFCPSRDSAKAALNTVDFCIKYGFDGIDLDLEDVPSYIDSTYLKSYIKIVKEHDETLFVTAAPQISGGYGGPAAFSPNAIFTADLLKNASFDALLVQEYNQFGGAVFNGLKDNDLGFISASFGPLTQLVPKGTKIVIGEPANKDAGTGLSNPLDIVKDINNGGVVLKNQQYGGIMVWAINYDYAQDWSFSRGVQPVIKNY